MARPEHADTRTSTRRRRRQVKLSLPDTMPLCRSLGRGKWRTAEEWRFAIVYGGEEILCKVPAGFVTDLFSVPRVFQNIVTPDGNDARPSLVHDYCYATSGLREDARHAPRLTREECDLALLLAMKETGFPLIRRHTIHRAVRLGGWLPWRKLVSDGCSIATPRMD